MPDERWVTQDDVRQLRTELRSDIAGVGVQLSNVGAQLTGLQVQLPLTYITRPDLAERLKGITEECDRRDISNKANMVRLETTVQANMVRLESTIQRLLFVIIGALITGGLALLSEVLRLLGHTP